MAIGYGTTHGTGTSDKLTGPSITLPTTVTLSILTYRNFDNAGGGLARIMDLADDSYSLKLDNTATPDRYRFDVQDWSTAVGQWSFPLPTISSWQHIIVTYDASLTTNDPNIYTNGVLQTETELITPAGTWSAPTGAIIIGANAGTTRTWDGMLGEAAIWNRILTANEIAALGKGATPDHFPIGCIFYSDMVRRTVDWKSGALTVGGGPLPQPHPRVMPVTRRYSGFIAATAAGGNAARAMHSYRQRRVA